MIDSQFSSSLDDLSSESFVSMDWFGRLLKTLYINGEIIVAIIIITVFLTRVKLVTIIIKKTLNWEGQQEKRLTELYVLDVNVFF